MNYEHIKSSTKKIPIIEVSVEFEDTLPQNKRKVLPKEVREEFENKGVKIKRRKTEMRLYINDRWHGWRTIGLDYRISVPFASNEPVTIRLVAMVPQKN